MSKQQEIIDQLIDYIDKAILKNSVSNRQVAAVLSFLNEKLKEKGIDIEDFAKIFLCKDRDDKTNFLLSMLGGAHFGNFIPGIIGAIIDKFGDGEMGSLVLRKFLSVPELRFNRALVYKGKQIISPGGGCLIESFTMNGNGTWTVVPKLEEGEPLSQDIDDILLARQRRSNWCIQGISRNEVPGRFCRLRC